MGQHSAGRISGVGVPLALCYRSRMWWCKLTAILFLLPLASGAQPSNQETDLAAILKGTLYVAPHRETADGQLKACGLEFAAVGTDHSTKLGGMVRVVGSFYLRPHEKVGLAYMLKLGVVDGLPPGTRTAPANAFVRAPDANSSPTKPIRGPADRPEFALFVGEALDEAILAVLRSITEGKTFVVGFNRAPGQQDVQLPIDLTVVNSKMDGARIVRERSDSAVQQFASCNSDLMKTITIR
ncbi:hypothetical protein FN976_26185 [Caenimonas sedimenti]|uniref:Uncharacterized protein n=1 Tax=Caenimonas sedimenti TaxID=2596921 RepID=A0A562ZH43_9BURK|nr:hypothetical protein [Caenimonas sedimenti]TWO67024.1 hypothetical protein FN976_26185 [Caenimonas sedimenti]